MQTLEISIKKLFHFSIALEAKFADKNRFLWAKCWIDEPKNAMRVCLTTKLASCKLEIERKQAADDRLLIKIVCMAAERRKRPQFELISTLACRQHRVSATKNVCGTFDLKSKT